MVAFAKKWRSAWLPMVMLLSLVMVVASCGGDEPAAPAAESESAAAPTATAVPFVAQTIKFSDQQFESHWINNAIASYIIENGLGHNVETIEMSTPVMQATLPTGEIHVNMEGWQQNIMEWYDEEIAAGKMVDLGMTYEGGPQFFTVPTAFAEEYGIVTIEDMAKPDVKAALADIEDPSKGAFINCVIGWQCAEINRAKLETYGLVPDHYTIISPGSSGAMEAALAGPQKKGEPVFGYYWAPTSLMGAYDWWVLEEPTHSESCWAKITEAREDKSKRPVDEACAYEVIPVDVLVNGGLKDKAPEIYDLLENQTVGLDEINRTAAWALQSDIQGDWHKAAVYYLTTFEDKWTSWMPEDKADKVKEALAAE